MKTNCWLILGAMLASSAIAQDNTNALPEMPAPVSSPAAETAPAVAPAATEINTPAPAPVKHHKHAHAKLAKLKEPSVTLVPGPAEVTVSNLIVRGEAGLKGEVIAHAFLGDTVTVLSQINLDRHEPGEPAQWAKISYPTNAHVWVSAKYIDAANNVVTARKLNMRTGPGENYNVVGVLEKGAPINQVSTKGDWMKIEPPASAYAFVAAMYLKQEAMPETAAPAVPAPAETEPAPIPTTPTPVPEQQPIVAEQTSPQASPPGNPPMPAEVTAPAPAAPEATTAPEPTVTEAETDTNLPPRVVSHEGVVRHVISLITPTAYELYDPTTDNNVDFLYTTSTNLDLGRYINMRIVVTGEEGISERWPSIPTLTIERIMVLDTNAVPDIIYNSPRGGQRD